MFQDGEAHEDSALAKAHGELLPRISTSHQSSYLVHLDDLISSHRSKDGAISCNFLFEDFNWRYLLSMVLDFKIAIVDTLGIFRSICFANIPSHLRNKEDPISIKRMMVGFPNLPKIQMHDGDLPRLEEEASQHMVSKGSSRGKDESLWLTIHDKEGQFLGGIYFNIFTLSSLTLFDVPSCFYESSTSQSSSEAMQALYDDVWTYFMSLMT